MKISFDTVSERDMDMLFMHAFAEDNQFIKLFTDKAGLECSDLRVIDIEISKVTGNLGESDITVIFEADSVRYGLLIEDKIDAIAMDEQHQRYVLRAEKGVENNEFSKYFIFIVCPEKYYRTDAEASKYENAVLYEEIKEYFESQSGTFYEVAAQQIGAAIEKAHRPPQVTIDERTNLFFKKYTEYQRNHYSHLQLKTKDTSNGYWAHYKVRLEKASILHKIPQGYVDLTIRCSKDQYETVVALAEILDKYSEYSISPVDFGKSAGLRILVPALKMQEDFEGVPAEDIKKCFDAISELAQLSDLLETARKLNSDR